MAKQALIRNTSGEEIQYTIIETIDDIGQVLCNAPKEDLITRFNEGETIIINRMGGYCFFVEGYHTIIS